jgi:hypothetical protein
MPVIGAGTATATLDPPGMSAGTPGGIPVGGAGAEGGGDARLVCLASP